MLELITTNSGEDTRLTMLQKTGDGNSFLANDGTYKTIDTSSYLTEAQVKDIVTTTLETQDKILDGGEY